MAAASRMAAACLCTDVGIYAELQAFGMNVIAESFHPRRETLCIRLDSSFRVSRPVPAIVHDDILIARILHPVRGDRIGRGPDQFFVHIAAETIPTVPPHRRSCG